jgi:hypothetical protein
LRLSGGGPSLGPLFNIVAFTIGDDKRSKLIQPPDIPFQTANEVFHPLGVCFPSLTNEQLKEIAKEFKERGEYIDLPLEDDKAPFECLPAVRRGKTAVCYDTGYYALSGDQKELLDKSRRVHHTSFLQVRPLACKQKEILVGFFQLHCCLPGLMRALIPPSQVGKHNAIVVTDKGMVARTPLTDITEDVKVLEFRDEWWTDWDNPALRYRDEALIFLFRLRYLANGWPRRIYNFLHLSKLQAIELERELRERDQQKFRLMIERLQTPLESLTTAFSTMERDTQELRAVLYDPAKALFKCHGRLADLFSEDNPIQASKSVMIRAAHNVEAYTISDLTEHEIADPSARKGTQKDGKVVVAIALLRLFGRDKEVLDCRSRDEILVRAKQVLRECEAPNGAFSDVVGDVKFLLSCKPASSLADVLDNTASAYLPTLKTALFDPFKLSVYNWSAKAVQLAVRQYTKNPETWSPVASSDLSGVDAESPLPFHAIISFLMDVAAEARQRKESERCYVQAVQMKKNQSAGRQSKVSAYAINVKFEGLYLIPHEMEAGSLDALRKLLYDHVLAHPREWRVEDTHAGNFRKPFIDIAGKLLGLGPGRKWQRLPCEAFCVTPTVYDVFACYSAEWVFRVSVLQSTGSTNSILCLEWVRWKYEQGKGLPAPIAE